jgi:hypothetical protein
MPPSLADSRLDANEERTFMVKATLISMVNAALNFVVSAALAGSAAH